jgi:hypothetical protein
MLKPHIVEKRKTKKTLHDSSLVVLWLRFLVHMDRRYVPSAIKNDEIETLSILDGACNMITEGKEAERWLSLCGCSADPTDNQSLKSVGPRYAAQSTR